MTILGRYISFAFVLQFIALVGLCTINLGAGWWWGRNFSEPTSNRIGWLVFIASVAAIVVYLWRVG